MQRWSSVLLITLCCLLRGALAYTEPIYEIVEDDIPAEDIEVARTNEKQDGRVFSKRDFDGAMPGVLRFGKRGGVWEKRESSVQKKEMPGVLRFGKRAYFDEKKSVPGVLRFGKRDVPMDKREIPGVLRFGKRDYMTELFDKRSEVPGVLRFGKRDVPGVLRFGKRSDLEEHYAGVLLKKSVPGVLRFGRK
ncbi:CBN-FLP-18 protein [Caenorhabditis brenneri]|uniref:CBN-FLP-18 protein n=1 Tax=Caenorhabditis brenneri TaxID=135651 RepID=G0M7D5_CAEBE|nr:CBN-FLP-18 protein [Caenorhabditis brenneri]